MVTEKNDNFIKKVSKDLLKKSFKKVIKPATSIIMGCLCFFSSGKFSKTSAISNNNDTNIETNIENNEISFCIPGLSDENEAGFLSLKWFANLFIFSRERCYSKKFSDEDRKNIEFIPSLDIEDLPNLDTLNKALNRSYIGRSFDNICHSKRIYATSFEDVEQIRKAVAPQGSKADKTKDIIPEIIENLEDPYLQLKEHQFLPYSTNVLLLKELNPEVYENNETPITEDIKENSTNVKRAFHRAKQAFHRAQIIDDDAIIAASKEDAKLIQKTVASEDEKDLMSISELKSRDNDYDFINFDKLLPPSTKIFYGKNVPSKEKLELLNKFEKDIPRINEILKTSCSNADLNSLGGIYVKNHEEEELVKKAIAPNDFYDYGIKVDDISFDFVLEKGKFLCPGMCVEIKHDLKNP